MTKYNIICVFEVIGLQSDVFEQALDEYLQSKNYDNIQEAVYQFARSAFLAGWQAAKNDPANRGSIIILDPNP